MKPVKITIMKQTVCQDLINAYENPLDNACSMKVGQVFIAYDGQKPKDLCHSAWSSMAPFVRTLAEGGGDFYDGWMKNKNSAMISCNDGFRPMSFLLETVEGEIGIHPINERMKFQVIFRIEKIELIDKLRNKMKNLKNYMQDEGHELEIEVVFSGNVVRYFTGDYSDFIDEDMDIALCANALSGEEMEPIFE